MEPPEKRGIRALIVELEDGSFGIVDPLLPGKIYKTGKEYPIGSAQDP